MYTNAQTHAHTQAHMRKQTCMHTICKYAPTLYTQLHKPTCEYTTHATTHKPTCNYTLNKQLHAIQATTHSQHATTHSQQHATTHYTSNYTVYKQLHTSQHAASHYTSNYTVYKQLHTANMQLRTANNMQLHTIQATTHSQQHATTHQPTCNCLCRVFLVTMKQYLACQAVVLPQVAIGVKVVLVTPAVNQIMIHKCVVVYRRLRWRACVSE